MSVSLSIANSNAPDRGSENLADRVRRLQAEATAAARLHVAALEEKLAEVCLLSEEIAEGGVVYPVGAREIARRLVEEVGARARTLDSIVSRSST